jgi:ATP-binding cassette subfamily C protein
VRHGSPALLDLLRQTLRRRSRRVVAVAAWSAVEAVPALAFGRAVAGATDAFLARHVPTGFAWLAAMVLAAGVGAVGSRQLYPQLSGIVEPLRDDLVRQVVEGALGRSIRPDAALDTGAVARITNQVEIVRDTFAGVVAALGTFVFAAGAVLLGLLTLTPIALAFVFPPMIVALALFFAMLRASALRQRDAILADEAVAEEASSVVGGLRDVIACGAEDAVSERLDARVRAQARAARGVAGLAAARTLALSIGAWLPLLGILVATPWLLHRGLTAGTILGMLTYVRAGLQPALSTLVSAVGGSGMRLTVTMERLAEAATVPAPLPATPAGAAQRPPAGPLELRSATFAYGPRAEPVIRDLDLVVAEDEHLAVVGPSGIGKSTLAGLLTGLLTPLGGELLVGGVGLGRLDPGAWTRHRVLIPQEAYVFAGTLRENLTYLRPDVEPEALDAAVDAIGLRSLVERLGGCSATIDPAALSAGERQLVALARTYLSPARLAVLDEATCHLDPAAEARAEQAFSRRPGALVVIAHRMSSALRARRVLVLDGTLAQVGTHRSLLLTSPLYADLVGHWCGSQG